MNFKSVAWPKDFLETIRPMLAKSTGSVSRSTTPAIDCWPTTTRKPHSHSCRSLVSLPELTKTLRFQRHSTGVAVWHRFYLCYSQIGPSKINGCRLTYADPDSASTAIPPG